METLQPAETATAASLKKLAWNNGAIWMGGDLFAMLRLLTRNRFRISPQNIPACVFDLWCGTLNVALKSLQRLALGPWVERVKLDADPIFIIGHWRTGTTLLHELLGLDPRHRCPTTYECFVPNHFLVSEAWLKPWTGFTLPPERTADAMAMGWDCPQEDEFALCNLGVPSPYLSVAMPNSPPQFPEYYELDALTPAERRRWQQALLGFLKALVWKRGGRLVLKSPPHTFRLPTLDQMFPRARYLNVVRNPMSVIPSTVRLWTSLHASHSYQGAARTDVRRQVLETFARMHDRLEATRGLIGADRYADLRYEDLLADPIGRMREVYRQLDLGDFALVEGAVAGYFRQRADYRPNRHELSPELAGEIARHCGPYMDRYGYR